MEELNKEYTLLFNGITDTIQMLERTIQSLKRLQIEAEEQAILFEGEMKYPQLPEQEGMTVRGMEARQPQK